MKMVSQGLATEFKSTLNCSHVDVCGSDHRTYSSVCSMLQNSGETRIAYAGRCNRTECSEGQVRI